MGIYQTDQEEHLLDKAKILLVLTVRKAINSPSCGFQNIISDESKNKESSLFNR